MIFLGFSYYPLVRIFIGREVCPTSQSSGDTFQRILLPYWRLYATLNSLTMMNLSESRKTIAKNFKESYGISIQDCVAKPSILERLFRNTSSDSVQSSGRRHPFLSESRPSAEEADRKSTEILSKW